MSEVEGGACNKACLSLLLAVLACNGCHLLFYKMWIEAYSFRFPSRTLHMADAHKFLLTLG
jgi:hypothetical protein